MRVAAAQYPIERLASADAYRDKIARMTAEAVAHGARLVVFPEYAPVELTALALAGTVHDQLGALQACRDLYVATHADLARRHGIVIVAGSFPERLADGTYRNRAYVFGPGGEQGVQEKLHMTRWEEEVWDIAPGRGIGVFDAFGVRFGVNVCLDAEFAAQARRQAEAGALLIVVPSCTDTLHGWHRVRTGALSRALENQCFVVMSPTVGTADWSDALDSNVGAAGVFAPMDQGFPPDGVIAQGTLDAPAWVVADLDFDALRAVRESGTVQTFHKGHDAVRILGADVEEVTLA